MVDCLGPVKYLVELNCEDQLFCFVAFDGVWTVFCFNN